MGQQIFLGFVGLSSGVIIAGGVAGLMIGLSIIPRYAGVTHTSDRLLLYEDACVLGIILGNLFYIFRLSLPLSFAFLLIYGLFSGIFLGGWILALAEMADVFPIFARRIRFAGGFSSVILSVAAGKTLGSLLYYFQHWQ